MPAASELQHNLPAESEQLNENHEAFFEFLREHYNKDPAQQQKLLDLAGQLEGGELDPDIPEAAKRIFADSKAAQGEAPPRLAQAKSVMCVKTWDVDGKKVFLNLGQSEQIDEPELVMRDGEEQTRLPMSLGTPNEDVDAKGEDCLVFDVLFHPSALEGAVVPQFLQFIVQMVIVRAEEKHPELPKFNSERKFKKLRQKNFKGRGLGDQYLLPQPKMREVDEETGLRDFSGPALAEPQFTLTFPKRKSDGSQVTRLRVELPGVEDHELEVRVLCDACQIFVPGKYKSEIAVEQNPGLTLLSARFHRDNHTLTLVWGPQHAKEFDEEQHAKHLRQLSELQEAQRLQLTNKLAFSLVQPDDY